MPRSAGDEWRSQSSSWPARVCGARSAVQASARVSPAHVACSVGRARHRGGCRLPCGSPVPACRLQDRAGAKVGRAICPAHMALPCPVPKHGGACLIPPEGILTRSLSHGVAPLGWQGSQYGKMANEWQLEGRHFVQCRLPFCAEVIAGGLLVFSGADRDRTGDPLLAKQVLSQLSYRPKIQLPYKLAASAARPKRARRRGARSRSQSLGSRGCGSRLRSRYCFYPQNDVGEIRLAWSARIGAILETDRPVGKGSL